MSRENMLAATVLAALALLPGAAVAADTDNGAKVFNTCKACHKVGDGAANGVGPVLNGIVGRKAGSFAAYAYSPVLKAAGDQGLIWTEDNIKDYLADPSAFLKKYLTDKGKPDLANGNAKMPFKLADGAAQADVIAYLKTFSK